MLALLSNKISQNLATNGKDHIRAIREEQLNDTYVISVFDSALSRAIGIEEDTLTHALIVVQVYYLDIFKDILLLRLYLSRTKIPILYFIRRTNPQKEGSVHSRIHMEPN